MSLTVRSGRKLPAREYAPELLGRMCKQVMTGEISHKEAVLKYGVSLSHVYALIRQCKARQSDADRICLAIKAEMRRQRKRLRAV